MEAIGLRLEAIATRAEAIGLKLEAIASRVEAFLKVFFLKFFIVFPIRWKRSQRQDAARIPSKQTLRA